MHMPISPEVHQDQFDIGSIDESCHSKKTCTRKKAADVRAIRYHVVACHDCGVYQLGCAGLGWIFLSQEILATLLN
jgi:hypothetical protein